MLTHSELIPAVLWGVPQSWSYPNPFQSWNLCKIEANNMIQINSDLCSFILTLPTLPLRWRSFMELIDSYYCAEPNPASHTLSQNTGSRCSIQGSDKGNIIFLDQSEIQLRWASLLPCLLSDDPYRKICFVLHNAAFSLGNPVYLVNILSILHSGERTLSHSCDR